MKVIGIQSSPNIDGLTCQLAEAALQGSESRGSEIELVHLKKLRIESCKAHDRGWGNCRTKGIYIMQDDFQDLRKKINEADALVFSTPVYFGDISESAKRFLDRWRRCENFDRQASRLIGKPAIGIAAAGGPTRGAVNALRNLETYLRWLQFTILDLVTATQKFRTHKLDMLGVAGKRMLTS